MAKGVVITGDRKVDRALAKLEPKIRRKVLNKAVRAGCKSLLAAARKRLPKDDGTASKSIIVRAKQNKKRGEVALDVKFKAEKIRAVATSPAYPDGFFYPAVLEYGSRKLDRPALAPMRAAYDLDGPTATRVATQQIRAGVAKLP